MDARKDARTEYDSPVSEGHALHAEDGAAALRELRCGPIICVVGPTASGKSELAQHLATRFEGEVVSADAMQIYRGMDIGTGKMLPTDRLVPHWGIDIADPGEPYSAALFQAYARACFEDIDARGKRSVLCGGTGFYVRAALDDYRFPKGEQTENPIREKYLAIAREEGYEELWRMLERVDAESARIIPARDVKRVVRAFEMLGDGTTYAEQKRKLACIPQLYPAIMLGLAVDPELLRARIDARVDHMFEAGLVSEVQKLLDDGFRSALTAQQAIGYKEVVRALDGECSLEEAAQQIKTATHRYAKRQRTWFRKDKRIVWIDADDRDAMRIAREAETVVRERDFAWESERRCNE